MSARHPIPIAAIALAFVLVPPAPAAAGDWTLRLRGAWVAPSEDYRPEAGATLATDAAVDDAVGLGAALEYGFGERWGLELGVLYARLDTELSVESPLLGRRRDSDDLRFLPVTLGLNLHLAPESRADVYLGALAAWVQYGDVRFDYPAIGLGAEFRVEDDVTWGVQTGMEVPFGRWSAGAGLLYLPTSADPEESDARLDLDALVLTAGLAYHFPGR